MSSTVAARERTYGGGDETQRESRIEKRADEAAAAIGMRSMDALNFSNTFDREPASSL